MQYSIAAVLAAAAGVYAQSAASNISYTTEIVTAVTTYCPEATVFTHAGTTYSVTSATTLTITDCPCTISRPVTTSVSTECASTAVAATSVPAVVPYSNGTATFVSSSSPIGTGAPGSGSSPASGTTGSTAPIVTAGAGKSAVLSGAGLAGVLGAAAFLL